MDERSQHIFRLLVEEYLRSGIPVGSRTLQSTGINLSPATIRNVMARLEEEELIAAPHTSAGRQPTEKGLRLFIDTLMRIDDLAPEQRQSMDDHLTLSGKSLRAVYEGASTLLSGLSSSVGLVIAPKANKPIRHIQFLQLEAQRILTILITQDGQVENRIIGVDHFTTQNDLDQVAGFLNAHLHGKTLDEVKTSLEIERLSGEQHLRGLTEKLVADGIIHPLSSFEDGHIFIQGQARLFEDPNAQQRLNEIRSLLSTLDEKKNILKMMEQVDSGEGVQVFIGSENPILKQPGWTTIIKAFRDQNGRIIGATGIIGPTRLNYGKIVPIVDYTSLLVERIMGNTPRNL